MIFIPYVHRRAGFALTEALIAMLVLAIFGSLVIRMFMVSAQTDQQARVLEEAVNAVTEMVESLKNSDCSDDFFANEVFASCTVIKRANDSAVVRKYFREDWTVTEAENAYYVINLVFKPETVKNGMWYVIEANAFTQVMSPVMLFPSTIRAVVYKAAGGGDA